MGWFVAGAFAMGVLMLGFCVCMTVLMARVNGEVARVLSESIERVFWPKQQVQSVEADPEHLVSQGMDPQDPWPEPKWETEDMSPYAPTSVDAGLVDSPAGMGSALVDRGPE